MSDTDVAEIHHPSRPVIGVVGLGAMGGQIAGRLLSQGNLVYGTNRTKAKADLLIDRGLRWCDTPRQVTEAADVIISMVTDSDALDITVRYQLLNHLTPNAASHPDHGFATT